MYRVSHFSLKPFKPIVWHPKGLLGIAPGFHVQSSSVYISHMCAMDSPKSQAQK